MNDYCLTYFLVKYDENFDMKDFCEKLGLDYETAQRFGTDECMEIGRNEIFNKDINVMLRQSLKDLFGKETLLLELKNKYSLEYVVERVPILEVDDKPHLNLSLDDDIIEFMCKCKAKDDLDYHIH